MKICVTVLSACDLRRAEGKTDVCPKVKILANGCLELGAGSIGASLTKQRKTPNPIWSETLEIEACMVSSVKFVVCHYRPVISDVEIGFCVASLREVEFDRPITLPLNMNFPCDTTPTLTVEFRVICSPYSLIPTQKRKKKLDDMVMFLTYDPPVPASSPAPVEFMLCTWNFEDQKYCLCGQDHKWIRIGSSGANQLFYGPTGPTYEGSIRADSISELEWHVILTSRGYKGRVTYNLFGTNWRRKFGVDADVISKTEGSIWDQFSIEVDEDTVTTLPVSFRLDSGVLTTKGCNPIVKEGEMSFDEFTASLDHPEGFKKQLLLPQSRPFNFTEFCDVWNCPLPNKISVVLSWRRTSMPECEGDDIVMRIRYTVFDDQKSIIGDIKQKFFGWTDSLFDGKISPKKDSQFQEKSAMKIFITGTKSWGMYSDMGNMRIDLADLPLSVKAIAISGQTILSNMAGDGCLRFIDPSSGQELGVYEFAKRTKTSHFQIFGALVRTEDTWTWKPINYTSERIDKKKPEKVREVMLANVTIFE